MKIFYVGSLEVGTTSLARYIALTKIKEIVIYPFDTRQIFKSYLKRTKLERLQIRYFPKRYRHAFRTNFLKDLHNLKPDLVWFDQPWYVDKYTVQYIRNNLNCLSLYFSPDSIKSHSVLSAKSCLTNYDIICITKFHEEKYYKSIAPNSFILSVYQGYDIEAIPARIKKFKKRNIDVLAACQYSPERERLMIDISNDASLSIEIYGKDWDKCKNTSLKKYVMNKWLYNEEYFDKINNAKITIGFLNREVGDLYTTRTFEIPACGSILLTERTTSHSKIFTDWHNAVFFEKYNEIPNIINCLLLDTDKSQSIATHGKELIDNNDYTWDNTVKNIITKVINYYGY